MRLADAGFPVMNHSVLLRGINDDADVLDRCPWARRPGIDGERPGELGHPLPDYRVELLLQILGRDGFFRPVGHLAAFGQLADHDAGAHLHALGFHLFDAPVGLFFSIPRRFGPPQWAHLGMFIQTVMLLAVERGLGACAQEAWAATPVAARAAVLRRLRAWLLRNADEVIDTVVGETGKTWEDGLRANDWNGGAIERFIINTDARSAP